jgi:hypothetical protein
MDVPNQFQKIAIGIYEDRFVTATKELAVYMMGLVEALGINAVNVSHTSG